MELDYGSIFVSTIDIVAKFTDDTKTSWSGTVNERSTNTLGMEITMDSLMTSVGVAVKK